MGWRYVNVSCMWRPKRSSVPTFTRPRRHGEERRRAAALLVVERRAGDGVGAEMGGDQLCGERRRVGAALLRLDWTAAAVGADGRMVPRCVRAARPRGRAAERSRRVGSWGRESTRLDWTALRLRGGHPPY